VNPPEVNETFFKSEFYRKWLECSSLDDFSKKTNDSIRAFSNFSYNGVTYGKNQEKKEEKPN
jgi:hypothetical protein